MGLGFAGIVLISLSCGASSRRGQQELASALRLTLALAVIFARLFSILMEDGLLSLLKRPIRTLFRPGFWLHGGLSGAAAGALISYRLGQVEEFAKFAGSLAISLPLYEGFSRIGCHTYGCCYGRVVDKSTKKSTLWYLVPFPAVIYDHPTHYAVTRIQPALLNKELIPIQLISSALFFSLFFFIALPLSLYCRLEIAGSATLALHGVIRMLTEKDRMDYRGEQKLRLSTTGRITAVQIIFAGGLIARIMQKHSFHSADYTPYLPIRREHLGEFTFPIILGIIVYGVHVGEVGSWI